MNKRLYAGLVISAFVLSGCGSNNDLPSPEVPPTIINSPTATTAGPTAPSTRDLPTPSRTATVAPEPPATQFAKRWGLLYPDISESTILKTANIVCDITKGEVKAIDNPLILVELTDAINSSGIKVVDVQKFTMDTVLNYCETTVNPT